MAWLEIRGVGKEYQLGGSAKTALCNFSLSLEKGGFVSIIGRSGSGKTTFLRIMAGLTEKTSGEIIYADGRSPRVGMVFQEPRLMPWLTVEGNILFPYMAGDWKNRPVARARELIETLGLSGYANAYPDQLSGGMAQRTALGRALCWEPELLLMDEPLGSLDYFTRLLLQEEILKIYLNENKTILFVTHDVDEAVTLSRKIAVLDGGEVIKTADIEMDYPRKRTDPKFIAITEELLAAIKSRSANPRLNAVRG